MITFLRWLGSELAAAESRPALRAPHVGLFNEVFRALAYSATPIACAVVLEDPKRVVGVAVLSSLGLARAVVGLMDRGRRPQAPGAFVDLVVAPIIIAVGLGRPGFSAAVGLLIAGLFLASFELRWWVALIGVAMGSAGTIASGVLVEPGRQAAYETGGAVLVGVLLVSAAIMLVFQWQRARNALSVSEVELATILAGAPVMLCRVSPDLTLSSVSGSAAEPTWQVGVAASAVMPPALVSLIRHAFEGPRAVGDVEVGRRSFEITCEPIGDGVVVTGFDVTEREAARAELEQLIRTKDEFVASISHELRTPLTAVLGFSNELHRAGAVADEYVPYLDTVVEQSAEMAAIIEDLLVAVRADLDIFTVVDRPVHLATELDLVVRALAPRMSKPVQISSGDAAVLADSGRVRQILRNLVVNADRYGGSRVEVDIRLESRHGVVEVRDDGPPIPVELRERMFQPFESTGRIQGRTAALGLGLSVSRRLADLMGGRLEYRHTGGWSRFLLELPLIEDLPIVRSA